MLTKRNKRILASPIVGRVIVLNGYIMQHRPDACKMIQRIYVAKIIADASLLFLYAIRQLRGKDYVKRTIELCEEIEAQAYLVANLQNGWKMKVAADINVMTEEIVSQVEAFSQSQNHQLPEEAG